MTDIDDLAGCVNASRSLDYTSKLWARMANVTDDKVERRRFRKRARVDAYWADLFADSAAKLLGQLRGECG